MCEEIHNPRFKLHDIKDVNLYVNAKSKEQVQHRLLHFQDLLGDRGRRILEDGRHGG